MYQKYTYAEAAVGAIEAGADLILAPKNLQKSYDGILDAVKKGQLTEERIDESLRRIYRVRFS
jgi:beta-N-acetylhexosaminidase